VQAIATAHNADLALSPQPRGGLSIEVSFPAPTSVDERSPHAPPTIPPCAVPLDQTGQPGNDPTAPVNRGSKAL
jgi:hypothetical protein